MFGYIYKDLTNAEKLQRRHALDAVGYNTVVSQLTILILAYLYRLLFCTRRRRGENGFLRRLEWRLTTPLSWTSPNSKSLADWGVSCGWFGWMVWLVMRDTSDDYLHLTKSFGIAAAANLPMHMLLSMKCTPLRILFSVSYDGKANYMHQGLGKILYLLLSVHVALYLKFFWDTNRMRTRLLEFDILCGVAGFAFLNMLVAASYPWVRRSFYSVFYRFHILLSPILFPLFYLHVSHLRPYLVTSAILFSCDRIFRSLTTVKTTAEIRRLSEDILHLSIDLPKTTQAPAPVSHLLLHIPGVSRRWTKNPFTIADSSIGRIQVVSRIRNGFTRKLAKVGAGDELVKLPVVLDMYYGACMSYADLSKQFDQILLVVGGVGGAFAVPWIKHLAREGALEKTRFVWAVRDVSAVLWAVNPRIKGDELGRKVVARIVEVHVTGSAKIGQETDEGVEMPETRLLSTCVQEEDTIAELGKWGIEKSRVFFGRPDLEGLLKEAVKGGSVAVMVCGPWGLGTCMKRAIGRRVLKGGRIWIHVEEFGG